MSTMTITIKPEGRPAVSITATAQDGYTYWRGTGDPDTLSPADRARLEATAEGVTNYWDGRVLVDLSEDGHPDLD